MIEVEGGRGFGDPGVGAKGAAALHAGLDPVDFLFSEGLIHMGLPIGRDVERPR